MVKRGMIRGNVTCPRCGLSGYIEYQRRGEHTYVYCRHEYVEGGRRTGIKKCYLGAVKYENVERFQSLGLAGLHDKSRFRRYFEKLLETMSLEDLKEVKKMIEERLEARVE
jgi:hypothetical protein